MELIGNDLPMRIYVLSKTKDINIKAFNMTTNRNEAQTLAKHVSFDFESKFNTIMG